MMSRVKQSDAKDIPADDPRGTLDRLADGLRRVLSAPKPGVTARRQHHPTNKRDSRTAKARKS